ncbi:hypothetical protein EDC04DRAFT_2611308 [Pisolithus marmoratus]|nr:hypothetical protein EDC04DRAFT_2611308 [Pisolithus marmoratus]
MTYPHTKASPCREMSSLRKCTQSFELFCVMFAHPLAHGAGGALVKAESQKKAEFLRAALCPEEGMKRIRYCRNLPSKGKYTIWLCSPRRATARCSTFCEDDIVGDSPVTRLLIGKNKPKLKYSKPAGHRSTGIKSDERSLPPSKTRGYMEFTDKEIRNKPRQELRTAGLSEGGLGVSCSKESPISETNDQQMGELTWMKLMECDGAQEDKLPGGSPTMLSNKKTYHRIDTMIASGKPRAFLKAVYVVLKNSKPAVNGEPHEGSAVSTSKSIGTTGHCGFALASLSPKSLRSRKVTSARALSGQVGVTQWKHSEVIFCKSNRECQLVGCGTVSVAW